jgi:hypothetical protein
MPGTELELTFEINSSIGVPFNFGQRECRHKFPSFIIQLWKYFITTGLHAPPM